MLVRGGMVSPHTMHFMFTLGAMGTNLVLASALSDTVYLNSYLSILYTLGEIFCLRVTLDLRLLADSVIYWEQSFLLTY